MHGEQGECRHLPKLLRVRVERDPARLALDPKPRSEDPERCGESLEVRLAARWTDVDVDRCVPGVVQSRCDTADDHEVDVVVGQRSTDRRDPVVVDLDLSH